MAIVNLGLNQLSLFNNEINNMNLRVNQEEDGYGHAAPPPLILTPSLNVREQEIALDVLNNTPGEDIIVEATSNEAYWRTSRFFYVRYGMSIYYISTNRDITYVYGVERLN